MHWEISRCFGFIRIFVSMDNGEIIIYRTADGETRLEVRMESDSVWLTQAQMAELFQRERSGITKHIKNVFAEGEVDEKSNVKNVHIANLDMRPFCQ